LNVNDFLPFIISGIASGAIFGLAGTGLVLTYKTSGIFNFGHGAIATTAAYVFYWLHIDHGMNWLPALLISVVVLGPLMGLVFERVAARLAPQRTAMKIVGTIGIVLVVQALATIKYGSVPLRIKQYLPKGRESFKVSGVVVTYDKVIIVGITVVAVGALYTLFRFARIGVAMRAVVDDPDLLAMQATNPTAVRRVAWIIGSTFAALSGVLVAPLIGVDSILLTFLVVKAFGAAAVGRFSSIPLTFLGGVLIGIGSDVSKKYVLNTPWLAGFPEALPFIVLFVVLLALPKRKLVMPSRAEARPALQYRSPNRVRLTAGLVLLVPLAFVPDLVGSKLAFFTVAMVTVVMLLSLGLLVKTSGQVSLCHAAFAAIGAVAFSQFHVDHGMPWVLALLLGGLVAVPVGAIVAIPAIRLSGLYLALATLGFGILVQRLLYGQAWMFTTVAEGRPMPKPSFAESPEAYYRVVLVIVVLTALAVVAIQRGRLGRILQGMSDSPTAVTAMGLSTNVSKVIIFCTSAFIAGIAGALLGVARGFAVGGDPFFIPFNSLILLAMLAIAPLAEPWFALIPAIGTVLPAYFHSADTPNWLNAFFGVSALAVAMQGGHPAMKPRLRALLDRIGGARPAARPAHAPTARTTRPAYSPGIEVRDLSVRFGGLVAVDRLSFEAPLGRITGLIGPNGAGKTTTFDACSGLNRRFHGKVLLHDEDITSLPPAARGRRGLGRTFQRMELCDSLTVLENVTLGREAGFAGARVVRQMVAPPAEQSETIAEAWSALELCGIAELADRQAGAISTGQRRLVELARALAGQFDVLLLDEPSSGLDLDETARFGQLLSRIVAERNIGILLVEHDMSLVMNICDYIYVLDFGRLIFDGTPQEVAASAAVQAAYLGDDGVMEQLDDELIEELAEDLGERTAPTAGVVGA
jgi:ABC-type branched-subunit amino acid transport system ATPase component/branched-subunit amino acid ABC-type transport system permease component